MPRGSAQVAQMRLRFARYSPSLAKCRRQSDAASALKHQITLSDGRQINNFNDILAYLHCGIMAALPLTTHRHKSGMPMASLNIEK